MARAAAAAGLPYLLSTMATSSIGEVAEAVADAPGGGAGGGGAWDPNLWFQVGIGKGRREGGESFLPAAVHGSARRHLARSRPQLGRPSAADVVWCAAPLWRQVYVLKRRDVSELMIREVERLGYQALIVTVDAPRLGNREADEKNQYSLPPHLSMKNLEMITKAAASTEGVATDGSKFGRRGGGSCAR